MSEKQDTGRVRFYIIGIGILLLLVVVLELLQVNLAMGMLRKMEEDALARKDAASESVALDTGFSWPDEMAGDPAEIPEEAAPEKSPGEVAPEESPEEALPEKAAPKVPAYQLHERTVPEQVLTREGMTLRTLADRYYGNEVFWVCIYDYNNRVLRDPRVLPAGIRLRLPRRSEYGIDASDALSIRRARMMGEAVNGIINNE
ncbi:hypothetical protein AALM74_01330 [Parabacteroides segnis]|uniref:LysM peptidoglycan-binding domain-containing protein n=1 Tax=Parabacteroides segnis TaxID=2763058 RepID=UPI003511108C